MISDKLIYEFSELLYIKFLQSNIKTIIHEIIKLLYKIGNTFNGLIKIYDMVIGIISILQIFLYI